MWVLTGQVKEAPTGMPLLWQSEKTVLVNTTSTVGLPELAGE